MGFYEFAIGIGTILIIGMMWTVLAHTFDNVKDSFETALPEKINNYTVNQTVVTEQYAYASTAMYVFLFFLTIIIFFWIIKKTAKEQELKMGN